MKDKYNIRLPKSWKELTLGMLEQIEGQHDNPIKIISVLSNLPETEIASMPVQFIDSISRNIEFLKEMPQVEPENKVRYKGDTYVINYMDKLTFGEYVGIQSLLKANAHDYSGFLAILCRKQGEQYTTEFENTMLEERKKMYQNMPVVKVLGVIAFFLNFYIKFMSLDKVLKQAKETALYEIENIQDNIKNSRTDGHGSRFSTHWQRRRLRRLAKYIDKTY